MGKVVVAPKKKLFALLRLLLALSIFFLCYGIFQLLLGNSFLWFSVVVLITFIATLILFNKSIKNYYAAELDDNSLKVFQLKRHVLTDNVKNFKFTYEKLDKPEGFQRITVEGNEVSFSVSSLEHEGFDNFLKSLKKLKRLK